MTSTGDVGTRALIKCCIGLGETPTQTTKMVEESATTRKSVAVRSCSNGTRGSETGESHLQITKGAVDHQSSGSHLLKGLELMLTEDRRLTADEWLQTTQRIVSQFGGQWYTDTFTLGEVAQKMLAFKCRKGLKQLRVYTICWRYLWRRLNVDRAPGNA